MTEFSLGSARKSLDLAKDELQNAGVLNVWVDMTGSGWTDQYVVSIDAEQKIGRTVILNEKPVWVPELCSRAKNAVAEALKDLELGPRLELRFVTDETYHKGSRIFPISKITEKLKKKIEKLKAKIELLNNI